MYNNLQMRIFNYIINKLDLRIRKPSQAKPSQAKPSYNFIIFSIIKNRDFFIAIFYLLRGIKYYA